jgi:signal transduction histidine kinase
MAMVREQDGEERIDHLARFRLNTVRVGVHSTLLVCLALTAYPLLSGHGRVDMGPYVTCLVLAYTAMVVVAVLPWERLFQRGVGIPLMYAWSLGDTLIITAAMLATGGAESPLFFVYALTMVFAAISYPRSGQVFVLAVTAASYSLVALVSHHAGGLAVFVLRLSLLGALAFLVGFLSWLLTSQLSALEQAQAESDRRASLLSTVAVAANAMSSLDAGRVLATVVDAAIGLGFETANLCLIDDETRTYRVACGHGLPPGFADQVHPVTMGVVGMVYEGGVTVVVDDYASHPRAVPVLREAGFWSVVAAPVWTSGRLAAVLVGGSRRPERLRPEEIEAVDLLAAQAGATLVNAEQYDAERRMVERLAELDRLKQDFVSTVSHELRTPLTVIQGLGKTLASRWPELTDDIRLELLGRLNNNGESLASTITTLLDFSRLEAGRLEVRLEPFELGRLVARVADRLGPLFAGHRLAVSAQPGLWVTGDPELIERVVENLLSNAAKHTPDDAPVEVRVAAVDGDATVEVLDHGPGIPAHELEHLGDRFFRGGDVHTRRTRGTGLGLAFAREVLHLHGCHLEMASQVGEGSSFGFRLPLAPVAAAAVR